MCLKFKRIDYYWGNIKYWNNINYRCFRTKEFQRCIICFSSLVTSKKSSSIWKKCKVIYTSSTHIYIDNESNILCFKLIPFHLQDPLYHDQLHLRYHDHQKLVPGPLAEKSSKQNLKFEYVTAGCIYHNLLQDSKYEKIMIRINFRIPTWLLYIRVS